MIKNNKIYRNKSCGIRWQNDPIEQQQLAAELDALQYKGFVAKLKHWWAYFKEHW